MGTCASVLPAAAAPEFWMGGQANAVAVTLKRFGDEQKRLHVAKGSHHLRNHTRACNRHAGGAFLELHHRNAAGVVPRRAWVSRDAPHIPQCSYGNVREAPTFPAHRCMQVLANYVIACARTMRTMAMDGAGSTRWPVRCGSRLRENAPAASADLPAALREAFSCESTSLECRLERPSRLDARRDIL